MHQFLLVLIAIEVFVSRHVSAWRARGKIEFENWPNWAVYVVFLISLLQVAYWIMPLKDLWRPFATAVNTHGWSMQAVAIGLVLASMAVVVVYAKLLTMKLGAIIVRRL